MNKISFLFSVASSYAKSFKGQETLFFSTGIKSDENTRRSKRRYVGWVLLFNILILHAMHNNNRIRVTLPTTEELNKRFDEFGFNQEVSKNVADSLGGRTLVPDGVFITVSAKTLCYMHMLRKQGMRPKIHAQMSELLRRRAPEMIHCILQEHPEAMKEIEQSDAWKILTQDQS